MARTRRGSRAGSGSNVSPSRQTRSQTNGATPSPSPTPPKSAAKANGGSANHKATPSSSSSSVAKKMIQDTTTAVDKKASSLRKFVETDGHFSLVRNFHLADVFTLLNGFCGTSSILTSCRYLLTEARHSSLSPESLGAGPNGISVDRNLLYAALAWPLAGLFFDFMDGKVARWRKASSMLGQELDSLADLISFGVAPAVLAFAVGLRHPLDTLSLTLFVCAGIARLARFNATVASVPKDSKGKSKYFEGLPIPSSLILVGVMTYLVKQGQFGMVGEPGRWFDLSSSKHGRSLFGLESHNSLLSASPLGGLQGLPYGVIRVPTFLGGQIHVFSLVWLLWASMMVSKTLKIPKL